MGITINGTNAAGNIDLGTNGTITDLAVGGVPDNTIDNGAMADDAIGVAELSATGTASSSTYLRGDNTWATVTAQDTLSNRNLIINGDFSVRQKGDVTWNTASTNVKQIPDRWQGWTNVSGFNIAVTAGTPPIDKGFATCVKLDNNAAVTPGTNDLCQWQTTLEGQDVQRFKFGTSEAEDVTLSFWCKASATAAGQYGIQLMYTDVGGSGHQCNQKFTAATSWTKHTITFPGTGTAATAGEGIVNSNAAGLYIYICLAAGSGKLSGSGTSTWAVGGNHVWPTGQHNFLGNTSNELEFTGFQLETGSTATEFEHRTYADQLRLCQRYYYKHVDGSGQPVGIGQQYSGTNCSCNVDFPVSMRTSNPSIDATSGGNYYMIYGNGNTSGIDGSLSLWQKSENAGFIESTNDADIGGGLGTRWVTSNASAYIAFNAEL